MQETHNADVECCSENKVEGEDSWMTVNCLRGRLLAERMASRNAREEADQLGIRLLEVERLVEKEGKSRNRAEKKLKFLMKKLKSINISTSTTEEAQKLENLTTQMVKSLDLEELNDSQLSSWSVSESTSSNDNSKSAEDSNSNSNSNSRVESSSAEEEEEEGINGDEHVDDSMALVPVEMSPEKERVDPEILDATVKQVLESLRRAKEQLQSSMERRRVSMGIIKVG